MKKYFIVFVLILIQGCSSSDDAPAVKDLFSLWTEDGTGAIYDFTGGTLNNFFPFTLVFSGGEECDCDLTMLGTQTVGNWVLNSCVYDFGSGSADPGCNSLNQTGTYSKTNTILTIIDSSGGDDTYR